VKDEFVAIAAQDLKNALASLAARTGHIAGVAA